MADPLKGGHAVPRGTAHDAWFTPEDERVLREMLASRSGRRRVSPPTALVAVAEPALACTG